MDASQYHNHNGATEPSLWAVPWWQWLLRLCLFAAPLIWMARSRRSAAAAVAASAAASASVGAIAARVSEVATNATEAVTASVKSAEAEIKSHLIAPSAKPESVKAPIIEAPQPARSPIAAPMSSPALLRTEAPSAVDATSPSKSPASPVGVSEAAVPAPAGAESSAPKVFSRDYLLKFQSLQSSNERPPKMPDVRSFFKSDVAGGPALASAATSAGPSPPATPSRSPLMMSRTAYAMARSPAGGRRTLGVPPRHLQIVTAGLTPGPSQHPSPSAASVSSVTPGSTGGGSLQFFGFGKPSNLTTSGRPMPSPTGAFPPSGPSMSAQLGASSAAGSAANSPAMAGQSAQPLLSPTRSTTLGAFMPSPTGSTGSAALLMSPSHPKSKKPLQARRREQEQREQQQLMRIRDEEESVKAAEEEKHKQDLKLQEDAKHDQVDRENLEHLLNYIALRRKMSPSAAMTASASLMDHLLNAHSPSGSASHSNGHAQGNSHGRERLSPASREKVSQALALSQPHEEGKDGSGEAPSEESARNSNAHVVSILKGCSQMRQLPIALELYDGLRAARVPLERDTFEALIETCVRCGDLQSSFRFLRAMEQDGFPPGHKLLDLVMDLCVRRQHLHEESQRRKEAAAMFQQQQQQQQKAAGLGGPMGVPVHQPPPPPSAPAPSPSKAASVSPQPPTSVLHAQSPQPVWNTTNSFNEEEVSLRPQRHGQQLQRKHSSPEAQTRSLNQNNSQVQLSPSRSQPKQERSAVVLSPSKSSQQRMESSWRGAATPAADSKPEVRQLSPTSAAHANNAKEERMVA